MSFDAAAWCRSATAWATPKDARGASREGQAAVKVLRCPFATAVPHWHAVAGLTLVDLAHIAEAISAGVTVLDREPVAFVPSASSAPRPPVQFRPPVARRERRRTQSGPERVSASPKRVTVNQHSGRMGKKVISWVPEDRHAELTAAAEQEGRTMSNFVRMVLERELDARRKQSEAA